MNGWRGSPSADEMHNRASNSKDRALRPKVVVFELYPSFHSAGYLKALFSGKPSELSAELLTVSVLHSKNNPEIEDVLTEAAARGYRVQRMEAGEILNQSRRSLLIASYRFLRAAERICKEEQPDRTVILYLDLVLPWLVGPWSQLLFPTLGRHVSGIVFNGYAFRSRRRKPLKRRLVDAWDRFCISKALTSPRFTSVWFLDHDIVPELRRRDPEGERSAQPCVDPWTPFKTASQSQAMASLDLDQPAKFNVLTLGSHSRRKGTLWLLQAFQQLTHDSPDWRLIVAGPIKREIRSELQEMTSAIRAQGGDVVVMDRFVNDDEVWELIQAADIVACPYIDFWGSSNVFIRACAAGKAVVGSKDGVMEDALRRFNCGEVIEGFSPADLALALKKVRGSLAEKPTAYVKGCFDYSQFHTARRFREQICGASQHTEKAS